MSPVLPRPGRVRRAVALSAAALLVLAATACDPPPAPDGRDLGVTVDPLPPSVVEEGATVTLTGTVTNHGAVAADGVSFAYAVDALVTVDQVDLGPGATCSVVSVAQITCTLADPLAPAASRAFTLLATAGTTSGAANHVVAAWSAGSEPGADPNSNVAVVATQVRPPAAATVALDLANGTNYLGTGGLLGAAGVPGHPAEGVFLSVNPYCTDKVNGDRHQSRYSGGTCSGAVNSEYRPEGYTYRLEVPEGRTSSLDVLLWDARYSEATLPGGEAAIDDYRQDGAEPFTFSLYAADATPLNPLDNPLLCTRTFQAGDAFDRTFLGSERWNALCSVDVAHPAGTYYLRVRNGGAVTSPEGDGSNQFGIAAVYRADGSDPAGALCRPQERVDCPVVSSAGLTSLYVNQVGNVARVRLGSIGAEQEGRLLRLELFDPGEGMSLLRVLAPTGPGTWTRAAFQWTSVGVGASTGPVQSLDVSGSRFNGRVVSIDVDLAGHVPPTGNQDWLVEYVSGGSSVVTDRTTWSGAIGDATP